MAAGSLLCLPGDVASYSHPVIVPELWGKERRQTQQALKGVESTSSKELACWIGGFGSPHCSNLGSSTMDSTLGSSSSVPAAGDTAYSATGLLVACMVNH